MKTLGSNGAENTLRPPRILQGGAVDGSEPNCQPRLLAGGHESTHEKSSEWAWYTEGTQ